MVVARVVALGCRMKPEGAARRGSLHAGFLLALQVALCVQGRSALQ